MINETVINEADMEFLCALLTKELEDRIMDPKLPICQPHVFIETPHYVPFPAGYVMNEFDQEVCAKENISLPWQQWGF